MGLKEKDHSGDEHEKKEKDEEKEKKEKKEKDDDKDKKDKKDKKEKEAPTPPRSECIVAATTTGGNHMALDLEFLQNKLDRTSGENDALRGQVYRLEDTIRRMESRMDEQDYRLRHAEV